MLNEDVSESLAYGIVEIRSKIIAYYQDEEHERAFQEWHMQRYRRYAPPISCPSTDSKSRQTE